MIAGLRIVAGAYASTPDASSLDLTSDMDIRALAWPSSWNTGDYQVIAAKWDTASLSWWFGLLNGCPVLAWTTDGTFDTYHEHASDTAVPHTGLGAVRVTIDVDTGAGQHAIRFYTSTDTDLLTATWTQLGSTVTVAGTTSVYAGTAALRVGLDGDSGSQFTGWIMAFQLRSASLVLRADFQQAPAGTSYTDDTGFVWTASGTVFKPTKTRPPKAKVDLYYSGAWHDVTDDVRAPITIQRGRKDQLSRVTPTQVDYGLYNRDGKYSPRNTDSPLFGLIGRNTPTRVYVPIWSDNFANRTVTSGWGWPTSGHAWASVTSGTASAAVSGGTATHGASVANSYWANYLILTPRTKLVDCEVRVSFTGPADVTGAAIEPANLMCRVQGSTTYYLLRVSVSASEVVTVALRKIVAGVETSLTSAVTVSDFTWTGQTLMAAMCCEGPIIRGKVWDPAGTEPIEWQVTERDADLKYGSVGVRTGRAASNTNNLTVTYDNFEVRLPRAVAELGRLPQTWTPDARDNNTRGVVVAQVGAQGPLYRMAGGGSKTTARSAPYRYLTSGAQTGLACYWPLEDGPLATQGEAATEDTDPFEISYDPGGANQVFGAGELAPWLPRGVQLRGTAGASASLPTGFATGKTNFDMLVYTRSEVQTNNAAVLAWSLYSSSLAGGNIYTYQLRAEWNSGSPTLRIDRITGVTTTTMGTYSSANAAKVWDGQPHLWGLGAQQSGGNVLVVASVDGVSLGGFTHTSATIFGTGTDPQFGLNIEAVSFVVFGHAQAWARTGSGPDQSAIYTAITGYPGETAGNRAIRIATEYGLDVTNQHTTLSAACGPQPVEPPLDVILDGFTADGGVVYEARSNAGLLLAAAAREGLYHEDPTVTLDAAAGQLAVLEPSEDVQYVANDVIAERVNGGTYRAEQTAGPNNTGDPWATTDRGVGRFSVTRKVNVNLDTQLAQRAWRELHLGTWDEQRYPRFGVKMHRLYAVALFDLAHAAAAVDTTRDADIMNIPSWVGPAGRQKVHGYTEVFDGHEWDIVWNATPATPFGLVLADFFDRTESSGLGKATYGPAWDGSSANLSVSAGRASIACTSASFTSANASLAYDVTDVEIQMLGCAISATPSGAGCRLECTVRFDDSFTTFQDIGVSFNTDGTISVHRIDSAAAESSAVIPGATGTDQVDLLARVVGTSLKIWGAPAGQIDTTTAPLLTATLTVTMAGPVSLFGEGRSGLSSGRTVSLDTLIVREI